MTSLDRESLFFKTEKIRSGLRTLRKLAKMGYSKYNRGIEHKMTAERLLQVCIQAALDVGNHLIASEGFQAPLEYRDVFRILEREKVIGSQLARQCQNMVGLRNRLVHEYTEIDHKKIYRSLRDDLDDFEAYVKAIVRFVKKDR